MGNNKTDKRNVNGKMKEFDSAVIYDDDTEYIINAQGGRVYMDISKHKQLDIPLTMTGKVYHVLSAGFIHMIPIVTIQDDKLREVFTLPIIYSRWINYCRLLSNTDAIIFPSNIRFGHNGETYFTESIDTKY